MTGKEGGGFVFDTNSLHRGKVEGVRPRTAVILEFHQHHKAGRARGLAGGKVDNPCPSVWPKGRISKHQEQELQLGRSGFPLYPQEAAKLSTD